MQSNLKMIIGAVILSTLICVGTFLYSQWDLRRFAEELEAVLEPVSPRDMTTKVPFGQVEPESLEGQGIEIESKAPEIETDNPELTELDFARDTVDTVELEFDGQSVFDFDVESPEDALVERIDVTDRDKRKAARKVAVADYNAYLATDSEYAYIRLADVFRADVGDHPEVDVIVESVRKANNGPLTLDDAIIMKEAILRAYGYEEETADRLKVLLELKELEAESGEPAQIIYRKITIE